MKKTILIMLCFGSFWALNTLAASSSCYSITNNDQRNFCLAQSKNSASYCYAISNSNNRNMCLSYL